MVNAPPAQNRRPGPNQVRARAESHWAGASAADPPVSNARSSPPPLLGTVVEPSQDGPSRFDFHRFRRSWMQQQRQRQAAHQLVRQHAAGALSTGVIQSPNLTIQVNHDSRLRFIRDRVTRYAESVREMQVTIGRFESMAAEASRVDAFSTESGQDNAFGSSIDWQSVRRTMSNIDVTIDLLAESIQAAQADLTRMLSAHRLDIGLHHASSGEGVRRADFPVPSPHHSHDFSINGALLSFSQALANLDARLERVSTALAIPTHLGTNQALDSRSSFSGETAPSPTAATIGPFSLARDDTHQSPHASSLATEQEQAAAQRRSEDRTERERLLASSSPGRRALNLARRLPERVTEEKPQHDSPESFTPNRLHIPSSHVPLHRPSASVVVNGVEYRDCFGRWLSEHGESLSAVRVVDSELDTRGTGEDDGMHETFF
ncbi:hypothetical protein PYCC9005_001037 [Savitreella phatthalungensis]